MDTIMQNCSPPAADFLRNILRENVGEAGNPWLPPRSDIKWLLKF